MRRGNITNKAIFFIVLVAIFTLLSYLFDQLVINSEDKLRNTKILYENKKNELVKYESLSNSFTNITAGIRMNNLPLLLKRNFFIKSLILFDKDQKHKDFFDVELYKNHDVEYYVKYKMLNEFVDLAVFIENVNRQYVFIKFYEEDTIKNINKNLDLELFDFIENPIGKDEKNSFQHDIDLYKNILLLGNIEEVMEKFDLSNWMDVYRYKMLLLKKLTIDATILDELVLIIDKQVELAQEEIDEIFLLIQKISVRKNYFILCSILSQVLSLLFLLFLFRSFVLRK